MEHGAEEIWDNVQRVVREALDAAGTGLRQWRKAAARTLDWVE